MYLIYNSDFVSKHVPEISMKDTFRHLPVRLTGIDYLDDSVVPLLLKAGGQPDTVELDDTGEEETGE